MRIVKTGGALGAEIRGVDFTKLLNDGLFGSFLTMPFCNEACFTELPLVMQPGQLPWMTRVRGVQKCH